MDIEIRLFGPLQVITPTGRLEGADFPSRKAKQVLQVLAFAQGRVVSKDRLIDTLWRRRMPQNPSATVELAVSLLRSTLARVTDAPVVVTETGGYRLDNDVALTDTGQFDALVRASTERSDDERRSSLAEAVQLASRPLFEDELGADWAANDRERFRVKVETAVLELGRLALAADDTPLALSMSERARTDSEAVLEEAYSLGVAALAQMGRRSQARALLDELETRLANEEARPLAPESAALRALLASGGGRRIVSPVPVDASYAAAPWPLPLLGRVAELQVIDEAVSGILGERASGVALVSGASGLGTSRVLEEVGARLRARRQAAVFTLAGSVGDERHELLAVSHLLRAVGKASKSRKQVVIDDSVALVFSRLADLLDGIGPAVLLLDEVRHLDEASIAVVRALLTPGTVGGLAVVAAARPGDVVSPAMPWSKVGVRRDVPLGLLSPEDLAAIGVHGAMADSGGHPATLAACVAAARRDEPLEGAALAPVLDRVDEFGELGRLVLTAAADRRAPFKAADVARTLQVGHGTVAEVLRSAAAAGVLAGTVRYGYRFTSGLLATALRPPTAPG